MDQSVFGETFHCVFQLGENPLKANGQNIKLRKCMYFTGPDFISQTLCITADWNSSLQHFPSVYYLYGRCRVTLAISGVRKLMIFPNSLAWKTDLTLSCNTTQQGTGFQHEFWTSLCICKGLLGKKNKKHHNIPALFYYITSSKCEPD